MNSKTTKRALLGSVLAMILCFTMLLSTTFAWFTDTVTSANNIIASGTLDVEMYYADGTKAVPADDSADWIDASTGAIFSYDKWEPGYVEVRHIKIANEGTLALKYKVEIAANGTVSDLADVIDVYYVDPAVQIADRDALVDSYKLGTLTDVLAGLASTGYGTLLADTDDTITLALKMQETAGNEYQDKEIGTDFAVQVYATQLNSEEDSFDNDYDIDSTYPAVAVTTVTTSNTEVVLRTNAAAVTVPASATQSGDVFKAVVDNNEVATNDATGEVTIDFDLTMYKNGEKVTDGNEIYAIAVEVGAGAVTSVKHNGVALTAATTGADQTYKVEGNVVTIYTKSFSPFSITYVTGDLIATNGTDTVAMDFDEFRASVNAGNDYSGWTVTLMNDIDFAGAEFTPIGVAFDSTLAAEGTAAFSGMFDGNHHTLSNFKVTEGVVVDGDPWLSLFVGIYAKNGNTAGVKNLSLVNATYDNANATVGAIVNVANSDGASDLEFSNLTVNGKISAFGYYGEAGIATLMYGNEVKFENVTVDVDFYIPEDFTVGGYKFISPCFGQLSLKADGHITINNVDYSACNFYYPSSLRLEDRSTVIAGYNAIWVYNGIPGTRVLGCGGYSGQFYDRGATFTIDGTTYTHAELLKEQKDVPGYMYDYIIRPTEFVAY